MWKGPNSLIFVLDSGERCPNLYCRAEAVIYRPSGPKLRPVIHKLFR